MTVLTIQQYKEAIQNLYPKQLQALQALYHSPNSSATQEELVYKINSSNPKPFVARSRIGKAGKSIADYCGIDISKAEIYADVVSEPYNKNNVGWKMHKNLQIAFEELERNNVLPMV
jgi:hypothetical protein